MLSAEGKEEKLAVGRFRSYEYSGLRAEIGDNRSSEI